MEPKEHESCSVTVGSLRDAILRHVRYTLGRVEGTATPRDLFTAVALATRDRIVDRMLATEDRYVKAGAKRVHYLSMEFLIGKLLENNLACLGLREVAREAVGSLGGDWEEVVESEPDAGLGNGGLGRLAACYLDSLATLGMPGYGYGINYEFGLFKQGIERGYQKEQPDNWLAYGTPWEFERSDQVCFVPVYGRIEHSRDREGAYNPMWLDWQVIVGLPYKLPVVGYGGHTVNVLRLYEARSSSEFDMRIFNQGDYLRAVEAKMGSERVSKILYPSDLVASGRELRLTQEYFLVACALRDITRRFLAEHEDLERFPDKVAIQMNDTHPTLAVAELMRILVDENMLPWDKAWDLCVRTFGFTNHTLMPEALEKWPIVLLGRLLPRHLQIIYEINRRFLERVEVRWPGDVERLGRMSLIQEGPEKRVRMANLAIVGSHSINGVSALHSELVKSVLVPDFAEMWPERFNNKTNGVTPRRWLLVANPGLAALINEAIGDAWITDLDRLRDLEPYAEDAEFRRRFMAVKRANKERLAGMITAECAVKPDTEGMFDVQVKRIHEYQRQLLKVLHAVHEYLRIVEDEDAPTAPRTVIFGGKAAPGYYAAKMVIKLIHCVGGVVNRDPAVDGRLQVVFLPDYRVSLAEKIIPAADLSEQLSTAGAEASGTGNMKFALNGALTMGTYDGANIEIAEEAGEENVYIFGLRADEIQRLRDTDGYDPRRFYEETPWLRRVLDALRDGLFNPDEPGLFTWIYEALVDGGDHYFHLADMPSYVEAQERAARDFLQPDVWARKAILNVARCGKFSSDRSVREYAAGIWGVESVL